MAFAISGEMEKPSFADAETNDSFFFIDGMSSHIQDEVGSTMNKAVFNPIVSGEERKSEKVYVFYDDDGEKYNAVHVDGDNGEGGRTAACFVEKTFNKNHDEWVDGSIEIIRRGNENENDENDDDDDTVNELLMMSLDSIVAQARRNLELAKEEKVKLRSAIKTVYGFVKAGENNAPSGASSTLKTETKKTPNASKEKTPIVANHKSVSKSFKESKNLKKAQKRDKHKVNPQKIRCSNSIRRLIIITSTTVVVTACFLLALYYSRDPSQDIDIDMTPMKLEEELLQKKLDYEKVKVTRVKVEGKCQAELVKMEKEAEIKLSEFQRKIETQRARIHNQWKEGIELVKLDMKLNPNSNYKYAAQDFLEALGKNTSKSNPESRDVTLCC